MTGDRPQRIAQLFTAAAFLAGAAAAHAGYIPGPKLHGSGVVDTGQQGNSVASSFDGSTVIVGGPGDDAQGGAAWVFTRTTGNWTQQGVKLFGTGALGKAQQGYAVALSSDGNTALVGGPGDESNRGASWVFTRNGAGAWTQQAKLVGLAGPAIRGNSRIPLGSPEASAQQGSAVALSADGSTAIVGGPYFTPTGTVWTFTRSGTTWTQQGFQLVGTGVVGAGLFGSSVDLSSDGQTAIVGGYGDDSYIGAAWVFTRSGSTWTQQGGKLIGTDAVGTALQGISVGLSANGSTAIVTGSLDNDNVGAAWVFTRSGTAWTQQSQKLVGTGSVGQALQGNSASLSADGSTAIVGAPGDDTNAGAVWVYTRNGVDWTQQGDKLVGMGASGGAGQGVSVALSGDGSTAIAGGASDNASQGAAWVLTRSCPGGDASGDKAVNVSDVLYLINFLFAGGPAPSVCY